MLDKQNEMYYYLYISYRCTYALQMHTGGKDMLTDMGTILRQAKKEGYGVAAPNVWSKILREKIPRSSRCTES